jgi:pimeloyl-ACP methyl ester carboxylesterase
METQKILQRKNARISYWLSRVAGADRTLIMLHGVASNHTRWSEFVQHTELKSGWNLLRLDLRGHGDSMYRGHINRHRWVADLHTIIEKEELLPVVLLGHSLGAEIALDYTAGHPEQVAGLILIDPVFHENLHGVLGWVRRLQLLLWVPIGFLWLANGLGIRRSQYPSRDLYALDERTRETLRANPQMKIADLYMNPFADLSYIPLANYLQDLLAVVQPLPMLEAISQPVMVIMSGGSSLSDQEKNKQQISRMPNATSEVVRCDHWPLTEQPETVRMIIDNWRKAIK